ncbi:tripartite tricarboxylate transporter TctB family protein [Chloroflexota bacterium]
MKLRGDFYLFIVLISIMLFIIVWSLVAMEDLESKLLPIIFSSAILILSAIGLFRNIKAGSQPDATLTEGVAVENQETAESWRGYLPHGVWVVGFSLGIYFLGFMISIPLFVSAYMKYLGRRWIAAIIFAVLAPVVIHVAFELALEIDLYKGLILTWLDR